MEQIVTQIQIAARGMWHYRWWGLAASWVVGIAAAAFVLMTPPKYEATARVYVDTQTILKPLLSGLAVQPNVDQQVALLSRTLLSRPTLEKLVRMTDLDISATSSRSQDDLIDSLLRDIQIRNTGRDNLYTLSFQHTDPERARKMVQSLLSIFVESGLGRTRSDSQQARKFIDEQIKSYEGRLLSAEDKLRQFRLKNLDVVNPDGRDANARLGSAIEAYERARVEYAEALQARDEARRQLEALKSSSNSAEASLRQESLLSGATAEIDARIEAQRKTLDTLMLRYTEEHPDVLNGRMLLRNLEEQKKRELTELRRAAANGHSVAANLPGSPQAELTRILAASEVQVASLKARVQEYGNKVAQARALLKVSPNVEAEAAQLNRDYALNKRNYEELMARRQSAELSGELDESAGAAEFRVIDPPRVSQSSIVQGRMVKLGLALAAAVLAGLAVAYAMFEVRPVFTNSRQLTTRMGLPLIGVVDLLPLAGLKTRRRGDLFRFYLLSGVFLALYAGGIAAVAITKGQLF